jgi:hypothetical protein
VEPPIPGKDLQNVWRLKQVQDAHRFRAYLQMNHSPKVAIIGGGLIGMEMTEANWREERVPRSLPSIRYSPVRHLNRCQDASEPYI